MEEIQAIDRQLRSGEYISKKKEEINIDVKRKNATGILVTD